MKDLLSFITAQQQFLHRIHRVDALFSESERTIARLAARGYSAKEIAGKLGESQRVVARRIEHITTKARTVYGEHMQFQKHIVPRLWCLYFLSGDLDDARLD